MSDAAAAAAAVVGPSRCCSPRRPTHLSFRKSI